jgi:hypothetical protein
MTNGTIPLVLEFSVKKEGGAEAGVALPERPLE